MILILCILAIAIALYQIFVFDGSIVSGVIIMFFSLYLIFEKYILKRKFGKLEYVIDVIAFASIIGFGLFGFINGTSQKEEDFDKACNKIVGYINDGKYNKAEDAIVSLEEKYGTSDTLLLIKARNYAEQKMPEEARKYYAEVSDKDSVESLTVYEKILISDSKTTDEQYEKFYEDAAKKYPEWERMQMMCGYTKLRMKNYKEAEYFLTNAYTLNTENAMTCFYLGSVFYYENKYDMALPYFNSAVKLGVDEETKSNIAWFLNEMGYFDQEGGYR